MSTPSAFPMTRERWAGAGLIGFILLVVLLLVYVFGSSASRSLRYTVLFSEGKGLKVGDRVQMSGVDIGEVDHVELNHSGDQVAVRLMIAPDHRDKVLANSTAYIADPTLPNVSGQKIVEVYNSNTPAPPMKNQAIIEGKNNIFELKSWQLAGQVEEWGKNLVTASEDLKQSAKELTDQAREAMGNIAEGVTESITEGIGEAMEEGLGGESAPTAPATPKSAPPASATKPDDAPTTSTMATKPMMDGTQIARKLSEFLGQLGTQGGKQFDDLAKKWGEIQDQIGPMVEEMARNGKDFLSKQLGALMEEIEKQMNELEKSKPEPTPDPNTPVAI